MTLLEEQFVDLNERLTVQESHYEGIRAAIFELRQSLFDRLDRTHTREEDLLALKRRADDIERVVSNGFAEMHRSIQMMIDRRDIMLLQRSVNETMKRVQGLETRLQALEVGQQELRQEVQELRQGQQELRQEVQELHQGQQRIEQTLQQILTKLS
jgi:chromosome segregation ATPase